MNTTNELRNQRARIWEQAKAFLDSHRDKNGILSAEDTETYERMEQDIVNLGKEIDRQDRLDAFERELKAPTSEPLTSKPDGAKMEMKTGRASDEYKKNFWNALRSKYPLPSVTNALQVGTDSEGGYLVPDEFERTLIEALEEENIFRRIATVIHSNSGDRKTFFPATNDEPIASLCYLEFMSQPETVEYLQIGDEGVIHTVDAATGAIVIQAPDDAHHDWFQNSGKNIDMTINCNGLRLSTPELTTLSLAYTYSDVDPADVQAAIEAASLDSVVPKTPSVGDIAAETEATDLKGKRDQTFDKSVTASVADFDSVWDAGMTEYMAAGGKAIADERLSAWEATYGSETMLP